MQRDSLIALAKLFSGNILDVSHESVILQLCAKSSRVDAFLKLLKPYGIIESSRSGVMAMSRSQLDFDEESEESGIEDNSDQVDLTMLPPG
jgi:acetolactate synthase-1/3 small subunit